MKSLEGKKVILTGATSGIGRSIAMKLSAENARLSLCGRSAEKMESLISELGGRNEMLHAEVFDIADEKSIHGFVKNSISETGCPDVLINCAGANTSRSAVSEISISDLEYMLRINLTAPLVFMKAVYPSMKQGSGCMIINILSSACLFANENIGAYTASKAGFDALCGVFRKEARKDGVRVCSVYPGGVDTPFREKSRPDYLDADEVAEAVLGLMRFDAKTCPDELVLRPMVETNF